MSEVALAYAVGGAIGPDPAMMEQQIWVQRARDGDLDAFDQIMLCYESRLLRFLTALVGDGELAQELCQDTFLAAYQALPKTCGEMRLSAWLHTIAINRARSHHRRRKLRSFLPFTDDQLPPAPGNIQESVATNDTVRRVIAQMPIQYVQVLLLQTSSGLSCREIASVLGCSEGAVKVRLLRARQSFRRLYADEDGDQ